MFDNLRDETAGSFYEEDDSNLLFPEDDVPETPKKGKTPQFKPSRSSAKKILGMTAQQRFIIAIMLMFAVCSLGAMCLLITGKFAFY